ncbi:hypothetical protein [Streptomyces hydrogenans]|uniref:Uncharacterized protein n=1 Tax=Streptomyces hydrogenans TaxID=1873719 RepID=A0ABQ3P2J3_9ACTN|nr:hypothetical protein [Streptomyces hydrogenans]GHG25571.1 hypothetical protein GCM10018784_43720 [Streptomyces hydrogenans]GHI19218.1 hypothetical protein Shyd_05890 [Streptomyces hydrogenans]
MTEQHARVSGDGRSYQAGNIICTTEATVTALRRAVAVFHDMDDEHHEALARQNPDAALRGLRAAPGKRRWWPFGTGRARRTER